MEEIQIPIFVESRYRVNRKRIKKTILKVIEKQGVKGPIEVSVAIVGDRKMRALSKKYKGEDIHVKILDKGFEYKDRYYRSLTAIAFELTGAHWNGFAFFNL